MNIDEEKVKEEEIEKVKNDIMTMCGNTGSVLAMIVSYSINKSVLWALFHGIFGWFYILYYALTQ